MNTDPKERAGLLDGLPEATIRRLEEYAALLVSQNQKLNLISRNTEADVWERHILHAVSIAQRGFPPGSEVVDWGTGGGLPSIPLAILFPSVTFHAVDATGKKIRAVGEMIAAMKLKNIISWNGRAEVWPGQAHYSVSRATGPLVDLWKWHLRVALPLSVEGESFWQPGLLCLKGGDLTDEVASLRRRYRDVSVTTIDLSATLGPLYLDKFIVQVRPST